MTNRFNNSPIEWLTDRMTKWENDCRQNELIKNRPVKWPTDRMTKWQNDWYAKWPVALISGQLNDQMTKQQNDWYAKWPVALISGQLNDQLTEWKSEKMTVGKMTSWLRIDQLND